MLNFMYQNQILKKLPGGIGGMMGVLLAIGGVVAVGGRVERMAARKKKLS